MTKLSDKKKELFHKEGRSQNYKSASKKFLKAKKEASNKLGVYIVLWPFILFPHPLRFAYDFLPHIPSNLNFI